MERVEYGTDGYPYKLSMSTGIENTEQYPTVEAIPKADYENRLKSDMVAILEEIQAQIDDLWEATWHSDYRGGFKDGCIESNNIIQQKINSLKEVKDGKDTSGYFEKEVYEAVKPYMDEYLNN